MNKEFVPHNIALELKELGFNELCFVYWVFDGVEITLSTSHNKSGWSMIGFKNNQMTKKAGLCTVPLYQQVFKWFRENHKLICFPEPTGSWRYSCSYRGEDKDGKHWVGHLRDSNNSILFFNTYEEAELECIKKLIEIVKK